MSSGSVARIFEIYTSFDGEVNRFGQGRMTQFIRFAGCDLACPWCDTKRSVLLTSGCTWSIDRILEKVDSDLCYNVTITGGEPLLQFEALKELLAHLNIDGYQICVETNGANRIPRKLIPYAHCWIVDYKPKSSGMNHYMNPGAYKYLRSYDYVKYPVANSEDVNQASRHINHLRENGILCRTAFTPVDGMEPSVLFGLMVSKGLYNSQLNFQVHKLVGAK